MSFDAWPTALSCGQTDFSLSGGVRGGGDQSNGLPAALDGQTLGPYWRAKVSNLPLRTSTEIGAARALEGRLDGGATPVLISVCPGDLKPQVSGQSPVATVTLTADAAAGATTLNLALAGSYLPLRGGEWLGYTHADPVFQRGYMVASIDGGTDAAPLVTITPPLRAAIASGQALVIDDIKIPMRLADDLDLTIDLGRFAAIEATFEEWFAPETVLALRALSLSPRSIPSGSAEDTLVGNLLGTTAGSTVTITDTAGSRFKLVSESGVWKIRAGSVATDYGSAHSHSITVRETLAGYLNSPRDSALTVNVTAQGFQSWRIRTLIGNDAVFFGAAELRFMTSSGAGAQPGTGSAQCSVSGGQGVAADAYDGDAFTEWARHIATGSGFTEFDFDSPWPITHLYWLPRASFPWQTPRRFIVEYLDGATWRTKAEIMGVVAFESGVAKVFELTTPQDEPGGHAYWRINVAEPYAGGPGADCDFVELEFLQSGANIAREFDAIVSSPGVAGTLVAFDGVTNVDLFVRLFTTPRYLGINFGRRRVVDGVRITMRGGGYGYQGPKVFTVDHSDDGSTWTTVHTVADISGTPANFEQRTYSL